MDTPALTLLPSTSLLAKQTLVSVNPDNRSPPGASTDTPVPARPSTRGSPVDVNTQIPCTSGASNEEMLDTPLEEGPSTEELTSVEVDSTTPPHLWRTPP